jgi:hypothetical protein
METPMILALKDMLACDMNITMLIPFVKKRTGIYAIDSLLQGYCPRKQREDDSKSF